MLTYDIQNAKLDQIPPLDADDLIVKPVEAVAAHFGLEVSMRSTLSTKRGSIHWHLVKPQEKGVLEITYWPKTARLWLEIHANRQRDWNAALIAPFAEALAGHFGGEAVQTGN